MAEEETEDLLKKVRILGCFTFFCTHSRRN